MRYKDAIVPQDIAEARLVSRRWRCKDSQHGEIVDKPKKYGARRNETRRIIPKAMSKKNFTMFADVVIFHRVGGIFPRVRTQVQCSATKNIRFLSNGVIFSTTHSH
jgi:hypothetical protein